MQSTDTVLNAYRRGSHFPVFQGRRIGRLWVNVGKPTFVDLMEGNCGNWMDSISSMKYLAGSFAESRKESDRVGGIRK